LDSNVETLLFLGGHFHDSNINRCVAEIFGDASLWSGDSHFSCLNSDLNYIQKTNKVNIENIYILLYLPFSLIFTNSSVRRALMLLISSFINK